MALFWWILIALVFLILLAALAAYICFRMCFVAVAEDAEEYPVPKGKIYIPYREQMIAWMEETRQLPCQEMSITSFDGLQLKGKFYEYAPGAPIELMMHGYRGLAERDLCGGVQRCFALGHSALLVDQRACGQSQGKVITFGILESRDCHEWIRHIINTFGEDTRIILTGISMGASTVLITAGQGVPENVIGVLADCGFSSAKEIIKKVIRQLKLPPTLLYPFVKLGARLYGGFDLDETSAAEAVKNCKVPVIIFHGEEDHFVPCYMGKTIYENCASRKRLVTIPDAGHGLCCMVDLERYLSELKDFFGNK